MGRYVMAAEDVTTLLDGLNEHQVEACVGGGWGVDALLGEQTREHSDLDLWLPAAHLERLFLAFAARGLDRIHPWPGDRPWNFVLHDGVRLRVDLHLYEVLPDGSIHYGSAVDGVSFPAEALAGRGTIAGRAVRCDAPEWAVRWHTGYPPRPVDRHDVPLLCERFEVDLPEGFA
ncbi:nucleotidyltransferase domain-containing protein [Micromonospora sp. DT47]|uniref:nucleotidyltransferase domain-containing protein n=1 Tax=Micromonospora sp. DT47 TaxID=3393431 RepID=UPI003CEB0303